MTTPDKELSPRIKNIILMEWNERCILPDNPTAEDWFRVLVGLEDELYFYDGFRHNEHTRAAAAARYLNLLGIWTYCDVDEIMAPKYYKTLQRILDHDKVYPKTDEEYADYISCYWSPHIQIYCQYGSNPFSAYPCIPDKDHADYAKPSRIVCNLREDFVFTTNAQVRAFLQGLQYIYEELIAV